MRVTVTGPVQHLCPYRDEVDYGAVEVTFDLVEGDVPELHELADYISSFRTTKASHEDVTRRIMENAGAAKVVTRWQTAGMDVTCEVTLP